MSTYNTDDERIIDSLSRAKTQLVAVSASLKIALAIIDAAGRWQSIEAEVKEAKAGSDKLYDALSTVTEKFERGDRTD
jgi:hypothetical protein